tara:strand:+ start:242 stop:409 length:168 start_codon:yes stop_codon:yes gene_type:complete
VVGDIRDVVEDPAFPDESGLVPVVQVAVHVGAGPVAVHVVEDPVAVHVVGAGEDD